MSLIGLLVLVIVVVLIFWVLQQVQLPAPWKNIVLVVVALIVLLYLLGALGVLSMGPVIRLR